MMVTVTCIWHFSAQVNTHKPPKQTTGCNFINSSFGNEIITLIIKTALYIIFKQMANNSYKDEEQTKILGSYGFFTVKKYFFASRRSGKKRRKCFFATLFFFYKNNFLIDFRIFLSAHVRDRIFFST